MVKRPQTLGAVYIYIYIYIVASLVKKRGDR